MAVLGGQEPRGQQADARRRRPCGPLQRPGTSLHGTGASPQTQMRVPSCPPSQMPQTWQPSLSTRPVQGTQACPVATGSPSSTHHSSWGSGIRSLDAENQGLDRCFEAPMFSRPSSSHPGPGIGHGWTHRRKSMLPCGPEASEA